MKNLLYTFTLISVIYLFGCGNDTTTNTGTGNGETVIFSMDSLTINLSSNSAVNDTNILITDAINIKISFNCSTNADSINSLGFYKITAIDSAGIYLDTTNNYNSLLNNDHIITVHGSLSYYLNIFIQINRINSNPYFIRLKNIKITKL